MFDWMSAAVGACSSFVVSLLAAIFAFRYQNWKSNIRGRVAIFYQSLKQIRTNAELLKCAHKHPEKASIFLEKIQFLPAYPFTDFDLLDTGFRVAANVYDSSLIQVMANADFLPSFGIKSRQVEDAISRMILLWDIHLKDHLISYFLLPSYMHVLKKKLEQEAQNEKE